MRVLVLNGPNLNRLGTREPGIYGTEGLNAIAARLRSLFPEDEFEFFQSNSEGDLIDALHRAADESKPVIFNPAGYTHTSVALRDAVSIVVEQGVPVVEVHLSNPHAREDFRHRSLISAVATGTVSGFGSISYIAAHAAIREVQAATSPSASAHQAPNTKTTPGVKEPNA